MSAEQKVQEIPVKSIDVHRLNPRVQEFKGEAFSELVDSVRAQGVIQPIIAIRENGGYTLIDGSRRLEAAKRAGKTTIPAIIEDAVSQEQIAEIALTANLQREDLTPLEEARGYKGWLDLTKKTQAELAKRVGKAPSTIANALRLLDAPAGVVKALESRDIGGAHGKVLLELADGSLFEKVKLKKGVTVRELQDQVVGLNLEWTNAGAPAIAAAQKFLAEQRAAHPKAQFTWAANSREDRGVVDLVVALGKPEAAMVGDVYNAKTHDKVCACRAYEIEADVRYSYSQEFNGEDVFQLNGFRSKRVCVDADGFAKVNARDRSSAYPGSKPKKRSQAELAKERARKQRERRDNVIRHIQGKSENAYYADRAPKPDVLKKFLAGGWSSDKVARLLLLSFATERVYTSAEMPEIVRGVLALKTAKVREIVMQRAAARVHSNVASDYRDNGAFDRRVARYELLTAYGVKTAEPTRKAKAKKKARR